MADVEEKGKQTQEAVVISQLLKPKKISRMSRGLMFSFSLFIAISLWFYVSTDDPLRVMRLRPSEGPETMSDEPLVTRTIYPELEVEGGLPDGVDILRVVLEPPSITITGTQEEVTSVKRAIVQATYSAIDGAAPMRNVILIGSDDKPIADLIPSPPAVLITAEMTEQVRELRVPIRASITGSPAAGYEAGAISIQPTEAVFSGPASLLADVSVIALPSIDITGQVSTLALEMPIPLPAPGVSIQGPQSVKVSVDIRAPIETMTFVGVPVAISGEGDPDKWMVSPRSVNVTIERSLASSEQFDASAPPVELFVDITNIVAKQLMLPVFDRGLGRGMRVIRIEPRQVTVTAVQEKR